MSPEQKYVYDPETCSFKRVEKGWLEWVSRIGRVVGIAIMLSGLVTYAINRNYVIKAEEKNSETPSYSEMRKRIGNLENKIIRLESKMENYEEKDIVESKSSLIDSVRNIRSSLDEIKKVIVDDPEDASGLIVLEERVEGLRRYTEGTLSSLRSDVARIYDILMWGGGIIMTLILSVIGWIISGHYEGRRVKIEGVEVKEG